jgi:hypothetical protein
VKNLATFIPEVTLEHPLPKRFALGSKLVVPIRMSRIEERDFSVTGFPKLGEGLLSAGVKELSFAPSRVGTFPIRLWIRNRKTLLASEISGDIEIVRSLDQAPSVGASTWLGSFVVDEGDPLRLRLVAAALPGLGEAFSLRLVPLGPKRFLLMQYKRPPSAAPDYIATRLDRVFLIDPPAKPRPLDPGAFTREPFSAGIGASRFVLEDEDWAVTEDESPAARARAKALLEASHIAVPELSLVRPGDK